MSRYIGYLISSFIYSCLDQSIVRHILKTSANIHPLLYDDDIHTSWLYHSVYLVGQALADVDREVHSNLLHYTKMDEVI